MGMFATLKGEKYKKCPKCGGRAEWQSKCLRLNYKEMQIWIGDHHNVKLDENMNGSIVAYCFPIVMGGCGYITEYNIVKGKLIEDNEKAR